MNKGLRQHLKQLPYFLLFNYPSKLKTYEKIKNINKGKEQEDKVNYNAYKSPSPMNELCEYICTWEKKHIIWDRSIVDTRCITINNSYKFTDKKLILVLRELINNYTNELREVLQGKSEDEIKEIYDGLLNKYKNAILTMHDDVELLANYMIYVSYSVKSINTSLVWSLFGDYIIKNLKNNSPARKYTEIIEVPYETNETYEYLGKYYIMKCGEKLE